MKCLRQSRNHYIYYIFFPQSRFCSATLKFNAKNMVKTHCSYLLNESANGGYLLALKPLVIKINILIYRLTYRACYMKPTTMPAVFAVHAGLHTRGKGRTSDGMKILLLLN